MEDDAGWKETSCISLSFLHYYLRILKSEEFKIGHSQRIVYCMDHNWYCHKILYESLQF